MTVSMTRYYRPRIFTPGELRRALRTVLSWRSTIDIARELSDGSLRREHDASDDDLRLVCDVARDHIEASGEVYLTVEARDEVLTLKISADSSRRVCEVFEKLERELHLEEAIPALLEAEGRDGQGGKRKVRCFLSYRFDQDTAKVALKVQEFLGLLDVEVITACAHEPRSLGEKVLAKVDPDRDFIAVVVSSSGESPWTRDEIGKACALGAVVIPVVEEGSPCAPGTFGDLQHIAFAPGHIGDAFLRLLENVRCIASHAVLD